MVLARLKPQRDAMSRNVTIQPDLICDVRYRSRGAKDRRRRRCRHKARLRRAGTDCLLGAVVPDIQPVIPVQLDFCHASDRNRRTCSANVPLAAGKPRGCTDRLQRQSTRPPDGRLSNPTHHLKSEDQRRGASGGAARSLSGSGTGEPTSDDVLGTPSLWAIFDSA